MSPDSAPHSPLRSVRDVVDGISIHGRVSSGNVPAHRPPLVFVHGLGVSVRYLEPTMGLLAGEYPVAGLDLPGFGRSGTPSHAYDCRELAAAVVGWLDARGIGPAVFIANSYGCQVVVELATRAPARVLGLVLNAPTMDPAYRTVFEQITRALAEIPRESIRLVPIVTRDYLRAGPLRLLATLRHALADRIEEKLPLLTVPTLVVAGARDFVVTVRWADEAARLVGMSAPGAAGATLAVIDDGAHALPFEHPAALAPLITALVERATPSVT